MVQTISEIQSVIGKVIPQANISTITVPDGVPNGLSVRIDHGSGVVTEEGMEDFAEQFPVYVYFSSPIQNWQDVMRSAIAVKNYLTANKKQRWSLGNIERFDQDGIYLLRLLIIVTKVYRP